MQKDSHIQNDSSKRHIIDKSLFSNNLIEILDSAYKRHIVGCAQKAEKIWTACILVSEVMNPHSRLVTPLISISGEAHHSLYQLSRISVTEAGLVPVLSLLDELLSLIRVGSITGEISQMNAVILGKEVGLLSDQIRRILVSLRTYRTSGLGGSAQPLFEKDVHLPESLFQSEVFDASRFGNLPVAQKQGVKYETSSSSLAIKTTPEIKETLNDIQKDIEKVTVLKQNDSKRQPRDFKSNNSGISKSPSQNKDISESRSSRQEEVLKILRIRKNVTIQDIVTYVPDCSIKTLQRILNDLIFAGFVEKRGNKRWTTYHIIQGT